MAHRSAVRRHCPIGKKPNRSPYDARQAAYDLKKLRAKNLLTKVADSRRYLIPPEAIRTIGVLVILREKVLRPILAGVGQPKMGRKPKNWSPIDEHYEAIRQDMFIFFKTGVLQPSNRQNLVDVFL